MGGINANLTVEEMVDQRDLMVQDSNNKVSQLRLKPEPMIFH